MRVTVSRAPDHIDPRARIWDRLLVVRQPDISVRDATTEDVAFLRAMIWEALLASPTLIARVGLAALARLERAYWRRWSERSAVARDPVFVAMLDGAAVGALTLKPDGAPADGLVDRWRVGMGVVASARGRGVGRALLEHARADAKARGARELSLVVDPNNTRAIAAYGRSGFARTGERDDGIEMRVTT